MVILRLAITGLCAYSTLVSAKRRVGCKASSSVDSYSTATELYGEESSYGDSYTTVSKLYSKRPSSTPAVHVSASASSSASQAVRSSSLVAHSVSASSKASQAPASSSAVASASSGLNRGTASPSGSLGTAVCTATATVTDVVTSTPTLSTSTVVEVSTYYINGDDGIPINPSTVPATIPVETSVNYTLTYRYTETRSSALTVVIPAPSGFIPVQDSLPGAIYNQTNIGGYNPFSNSDSAKRKRQPAQHRKRDCATITTTTTSTSVAEASTTTITVTKQSGLIVWPIEGTTIPVDSYPVFTGPALSTITRTITDYAGTTFYTTTVHATETEIASTTTVYAACATDNFANYLVDDDGSAAYISGSNGTGPADVSSYNTAYECCVYAIQNGGKAWAFSLSDIGLGTCVTWHPNYIANSCVNGTQSEQYIALTNGTGFGSVKSVIGNAYCGQYTSAEHDPALPLPP
ncbi:hypothetical protein AMS68_004512 [Peltaster fructicola]|uniref:Ig-like domain-containing protein n=1 Tax=Peltaster fructicola TaxID=286661 RepID=A0A6H0XWG2_9PEZI|nr:hypothetical protein AMS68_004512 [Peltaster fructicola]